MLAPLIAEYIHDIDGTYDVLRDALLERGLEPLPRGVQIVERLELVLARLRELDQTRVAAASVRRLVGARVGDRGLQVRISQALDAVEVAAATDVLRADLFRAWQAATGVDRRIVWAAWMVLRGSPTIALGTARAVHTDEVEAQLAAVAEAYARDLA